MPNGPTLLTGVNGSGKSTVLRFINAVGSGQWLDLLSIPFSELHLEFDSGEAIWVRTIYEHEAGLEVEHDGKSWAIEPSDLEFPDREELTSHYGLRRLPDGRWEFEDRIYSQPEVRQILAVRKSALDEDANWVAELPSRFPVLYVPDQRLSLQLPSSPNRIYAQTASSVDQYARDLRRIIADGLSEYAAHSQTLDRGFPQRVVNAMEEKASVDIDSLSRLLDQVGKEREELENAGLLEREDNPVQFDSDRLSDENVAPVIKVYAEQTLEKFAVLSDLKTKLKTFSTFLNTHYRDKFIFVRPNAGFSLGLLGPADKEGKSSIRDLLRPSVLSSGEQQMLVLAYEVIFRTEPKTLILIDEPELSLHVLWQSTLVDDLTEMGAIGDLSFILATHSPTLIADREELRVSLDPRDGSES
jgi:predicted ATPase